MKLDTLKVVGYQDLHDEEMDRAMSCFCLSNGSYSNHILDNNFHESFPISFNLLREVLEEGEEFLIHFSW